VVETAAELVVIERVLVLVSYVQVRMDGKKSSPAQVGDDSI